jgi:hypothetical protein
LKVSSDCGNKLVAARVFGSPGGIEAGQVLGQFAQNLVGGSVATGLRGRQHGFRLALLGTAGALLQGQVQFDHQLPFLHGTLVLDRRDTQREVRVAVLVSQFAILLGRADAGLFGKELRVLCPHTLLKGQRVELGRGWQRSQPLWRCKGDALGLARRAFSLACHCRRSFSRATSSLFMPVCSTCARITSC